VGAPERLSVVADRDRIEQVLENLLVNAIRYSPDGGKISVSGKKEGDVVHLVVRDRGLGVPKEHQEVIFERFARAHGPVYGGLGLGLAISKGIVEQHGGRIWVESSGKPGEGSAFHVEVPLRGPAARGQADESKRRGQG
jgi:signal transduction histidine kinase